MFLIIHIKNTFKFSPYFEYPRSRSLQSLPLQPLSRVRSSLLRGRPVALSTQEQRIPRTASECALWCSQGQGVSWEIEANQQTIQVYFSTLLAVDQFYESLLPYQDCV